MKIQLLAISLLALSSQGQLYAVEPDSALSEDLAKRLIADFLNIREGGINVATVTGGTKSSDDGSEESQVRRVTAVLPVLEEGRTVRRVRCYDFSWSEKYGWYYQKIVSSRSGQEVRIWSEKKGESATK